MAASFVDYKKAQRTSLILESPHSGLPLETMAQYYDNLRREDPAVRATINLGVDISAPVVGMVHDSERLGNLLQSLPARIECLFPRAIIDPNRGRIYREQYSDTLSLDTFDVDALSVEGAEGWNPHGGVWRATIQGLVLEGRQEEYKDMLKRPYTQREFADLVASVYAPYHRALSEAMNDAVTEHNLAIMLSLHSFPPARLISGPAEGKYRNAYAMDGNAQRGAFSPQNIMNGTFPDILLIHNNRQSCHPKIIEIAEQIFTKHGFYVGHGFGKMSGDTGTTALYGCPSAQRHVLGLELIGFDVEPERVHGRITKAWEIDGEIGCAARERLQRLQTAYGELYQKLHALTSCDLQK